MKDMEGKLDPADKTTLETELAEFKKVREGNNADEIKAAMEKFTQKSYEIFGKVYQQANPEGNPGAGFNGQQGGQDDGTYESNFTDN